MEGKMGVGCYRVGHNISAGFLYAFSLVYANLRNMLFYLTDFINPNIVIITIMFIFAKKPTIKALVL